MEINQFDLQCILERGEDDVMLDNTSTHKLIQAILNDDRFAYLVFDLYEGIEK